MANAVQRVVSDGTLKRIDLTIKFLQRADIHVLYNGTEVFPPVWQWLPGVDAIEFANTVGAGVEITIRRVTRTNRAMHVFGRDELGGNAAFTSETLDTNFRQMLMLAQESQEGTITDLYTNLDMHGYRIRNVGPAQTDNDIATLGQIKGQVTAAETASTSAAASATSANNSANRADAAKITVAEMFIGIQNRPFPTKNPITDANLKNGTRLLASASADNYEEFVWVSGSWVKVSTTVIDGTASYTKAEVDAKVAGVFGGGGQSLKDVTATRNPSTWYTNTDTRPIMLMWTGQVAASGSGYIEVTMRGGPITETLLTVINERLTTTTTAGQIVTRQLLIPPGVQYRYIANVVAGTLKVYSYE
ncbi:putative tail fiber protein [Achromobacter phage vB_AxyP_19-32_Axy23]|uniref:Putative tail fiber protein n=1 Tax=Achromobacter phage vB_AxyP_19-32_Axy23 TaxID=2591047 RepID=A0A514CW18_9CAUD|nr:putative tail fiber protein [Achromobacter phage vB_AxyP_19-32_Axy23]